MITVQVDDRVLVQRLSIMPTKVRDALAKRVTKLALELEARVKRDKLSGQVLNVRTGNLRRSISNQVTADATSVVGRVFSDSSVKYAAIHEFGGVIDRFGSKVGDYQIKMPQRAFMLPTFDEMKPEIKEGMAEAVRGALT